MTEETAGGDARRTAAEEMAIEAAAARTRSTARVAPADGTRGQSAMRRQRRRHGRRCGGRWLRDGRLRPERRPFSVLRVLRSGTIVITALFLLLFIIRAPCATASPHIDGAFPVDAITLPRLAAVADLLIRVDKRYPSGKYHNQFKNFCKRYVKSANSIRKDFFVATVGIESTAHQDNHNLDLATKLGAADEKKWPQYYFLKKGTKDVSEANHYDGDDKSANALANFIHHMAGVRFGSTGPLEEMDGIAAEFAMEAAGGRDVTALVEKAKARAAKYSAEEDKTMAEVYLKVMAKAGQKGAKYFSAETHRVSRMLEDGKMNNAKRKIFEDKLRVLGSFTDPKKEKDKL